MEEIRVQIPDAELHIIGQHERFLLHIPISSTIENVKQKISERWSVGEQERLRVVQRGVELEDDTQVRYLPAAPLHVRRVPRVTRPDPSHDSQTTSPADEEPRGFARLTAFGLPPAEIAALRQQFHAQRLLQQPYGRHSAAEEAEEAWLTDSAPSATVDVHEEGSATEVLGGLILGMGLGLPSLLWLADGSLSLRGKLGAVAGIGASAKLVLFHTILF